MKDGEQKTTSVRLPRDLLTRADALGEILPERFPEYEALVGSPMSRSAVLRLALVRGLESLEERVRLMKEGS